MSITLPAVSILLNDVYYMFLGTVGDDHKIYGRRFIVFNPQRLRCLLDSECPADIKIDSITCNLKFKPTIIHEIHRAGQKGDSVLVPDVSVFNTSLEQTMPFSESWNTRESEMFFVYLQKDWYALGAERPTDNTQPFQLWLIGDNYA